MKVTDYFNESKGKTLLSFEILNFIQDVAL